MSRQQLGGAGIELDLLVNTDVYLREIVTVEVRLQYLTVLDDALFLQLLLVPNTNQAVLSCFSCAEIFSVFCEISAFC